MRYRQLLLEYRIYNQEEFDQWFNWFTIRPFQDASGPEIDIITNFFKKLKKEVMKDPQIIQPLSGKIIKTLTGYDKQDALNGTLKEFSKVASVHEGKFNHITDWLVDLLRQGHTDRIKQLKGISTVDMAYRKADEYFAWVNKRYMDRPDVEGEDVKTKLKFKDGYRIVQLVSRDAFKREGKLMNHCVGAYCEKEDFTGQVYSLRDPNNKPLITIEVDNAIYDTKFSGGTAKQIWGYHNTRPDKKLEPYISKFLIKEKLEVGDLAVVYDPINTNFNYAIWKMDERGAWSIVDISWTRGYD